MTNRVLGWDLLRGLCALTVGWYHLLMWLEIGNFHSLGSYGVYLFFVLSGASLMYTYGDQLEKRDFYFKKFLLMRYVRLAPLYIFLMFLVLPWKIFKEGATLALLKKFFINGFFIFGFFDPAANSMLIGGWSLGIEAIYYLIFPVFGFFVLRGNWFFYLFPLVIGLQFWWIEGAINSPGGYQNNIVQLHQPQAFFAYFFGGLFLGNLQRKKDFHFSNKLIFLSVLCGFLSLVVINPVEAGNELLGMRGVIGFVLCFFLVWIVGGTNFENKFAKVAEFLGDATYGLYLIHPVVFFAIVWVIVPKAGWVNPLLWGLDARLGMAFVIVVVSVILAVLSEKFFEKPIRKKMKLLIR